MPDIRHPVDKNAVILIIEKAIKNQKEMFVRRFKAEKA